MFNILKMAFKGVMVAALLAGSAAFGAESSSDESEQATSGSSREVRQPQGFNRHSDEVLSSQIVTDIRIDPKPDQWRVTWPGGFIIGDRTESVRRPRIPWYPRSRTIVIGGGSQVRPQCAWIPGRYEVREMRVYQPGYWTQRYVPPEYETRVINGRPTPVQVRAGYYENVYVPGQYVTQPQRVWIPGRWDCVPGCRRH
ncbi:MAG: hypothetical protein R6W89_09170 [Candidatus Hydrogenedentota bacterium]